MAPIQEWIHRMEKAGGKARYALLALVALAVGVIYDVHSFKNMSNAEAMDAAQLARNIAEHKGYTTLFVRPLSLYLLQKKHAEAQGPTPTDSKADAGQIQGTHPDLANPPVYPIVLAGLMKAAPGFKRQVAGSLARWNRGTDFWIYGPDFFISIFNQVLFMVAVVMVFTFAKRWFDETVAWTSAIVFLGTDLYWRFSISGLSTMLLIVIFLTLAWCLALLDECARDGKEDRKRLLILLAAVIGILAGLGGLTRYAFGWLIIPVLVFLVSFTGRHRAVLGLTALAAFAAVVGPWVARNYHLSHTLFGTAGYAIYEGTPFFPENHLERSLHPNMSLVALNQLWDKLMGNTETILREELPKLGGNWAVAFFFAGLLVGFKNATLNRLRGFLLLCLPVLIAAQALGRTQLSEDSSVINSENLLVVLAPLVIVFGAGLFFTLLDRVNLTPGSRYVVTGMFCAVMCLPMLFGFASPRASAIAYPPYYPPMIQKTAGWMKEDELVMSDIPWAVAWYGERQSVWLTLNTKEDFFDLEHQKHVSALYLTPLTMDGRFLSQWVRASDQSWGSFIFGAITKGDLPDYFPLSKMPTGFLPEQMFLTDSERWRQPGGR